MIRRLSEEPGEARALRLGVVGATGQVGGVVLRLLADRGLPIEELRLFASARSAGTPRAASLSHTASIGISWTSRALSPSSSCGSNFAGAREMWARSTSSASASRVGTARTASAEPVRTASERIAAGS